MNTMSNKHYIPRRSTPDGLCLTPQNLEQAQITQVALEFDQLLMKPGFDVLMQSSFHLKSFVGWQKEMVLDASMLQFDKDQKVTIQSIYDGQKLKYSMASLFDLIRSIEPETALLPERILELFPDEVMQLTKKTQCFFSFQDVLQNKYSPISSYSVGSDEVPCPLNVYLTEKTLKEWWAVKDTLQASKTILLAEVALEQMLNLFEKGIDWIVSDQCCSDGAQGVVYHQAGPLDLKELQYAFQFDCIDATCGCETCAQGFTRAYLHHLLRNTPLLCQRLLIQHNLSNMP